MTAKGKTNLFSWLHSIMAVGALCVTSMFISGCDDDNTIVHNPPDLVDDDVDHHYVSLLSVTPGDEFSIGLDVRSHYNWSDDFVTRFYVSYNDTITDNDVLIGTYYSSGLDSGERQRQWITVNFPDLAAGRYYLGCIIDQEDEVDELNEGNNVIVFRESIDVYEDVEDVAPEADPIAEVADVNFPPIATCTDSDVFGKVGKPIYLTASGSSDPEGETLTYSWIVNSLPEGANKDAFANVSGDNMLAQFTPTKTGTYVFVLTVSDGENESTDTVTIMVE